MPLFLWRRTRPFALALAVAFHLANSYVFRIGVFPYLAIAACMLFFPGETLRRRFLPRKAPPKPLGAVRIARRERLVAAALAIWFAVQLALPLRHFLYPGDVNWTEEGHRMSWRMMLRVKTGAIDFELVHPSTGRRWTVHPDEYLEEKQAQRLAIRPDMIWQFAQFLERDWARRGFTPVEVHALSAVSLNGRPPRALVEHDVDLAAVEWNLLAPNRWITPLAEAD